MIYLHSLSPVAVNLGFFKIHWYGIMYLCGFAIAYFLAVRRREYLGWKADDISDFMFWCVLGIVAGGRTGYMLFYQPLQLWADPLSLFKVWQGGMSFHGAVIGMILVFVLYGWRRNYNPFDLSDFTLVVVCPGIALGRLGNFINGELWGKPTNGDWGVIFPASDSLLPRHPTQIYEAVLEGLLLFIILWLAIQKPQPRMVVTGLFLLCYGIFRILVEFWRIPDAHIGYLAYGWLTQGQLLTFPMVVVGIGFIYYGYVKNIFPGYGRS